MMYAIHRKVVFLQFKEITGKIFKLPFESTNEN